MRPLHLWPCSDAQAPMGWGRVPGLPVTAPVGCGWLWVFVLSPSASGKILAAASEAQ